MALSRKADLDSQENEELEYESRSSTDIMDSSMATSIRQYHACPRGKFGRKCCYGREYEEERMDGEDGGGGCNIQRRY